MAEYAGREKKFYRSAPGIIASTVEGVAFADASARMKDIEVLQAFLDLPNVTLEQKIAILGNPDPLVFAADYPAILIAQTRPFLLDTFKQNMSMTVHAAQEHEDSVDSKTDTQAKGSYGLPWAKVSVSVDASVSTHSGNKRKSDYGATVDIEFTMARQPDSEGTSKIHDILGKLQDKANEINLKRMTAGLETMDEEVKEVPRESNFESKRPEPEPVAAGAGGAKQGPTA